jgi:GTPase Era involved in 16S rRNA processing
VGRKGDKITSIATEARREIQTILNCAVELILIPIYNPKKFNALLEEQEEELDEE